MAIRWTRLAARRLEDVGTFIAADNPTAAAEVVGALWDGVQLLATMPHMGRPGRLHKTREWVLSGTPYVVVYRVKQGHVEVLTILHAAMAWPEAAT